MDSRLIGKLKFDAQLIEDHLGISYLESFKLAVEIWKAESLDSIAYFMRQDGEFQEAMGWIQKAINEKP